MSDFLNDFGPLGVAAALALFCLLCLFACRGKGFHVLVWFLGTLAAVADMPDQLARWKSAHIRPEKSVAVDGLVAKYLRLAPRYQTIERMRSNGVPAPVLFCLHMRESDNDFTKHAHEGSPLNHRTRDEPKGRLPLPAQPPFTFEQSAEDAYYICERPPLDHIDWSNLKAALDKMESFNGFGYRARGVPAPYLWAGTNIYARGKYTGDHRFDPLFVDKQMGCVPVLLRMKERGIFLKFAP